MTDHLHSTFVTDCFRCHLSRDEATEDRSKTCRRRTLTALHVLAVLIQLAAITIEAFTARRGGSLGTLAVVTTVWSVAWIGFSIYCIRRLARV